MILSRQFKFTRVTLDEVLIFIKDEIKKGRLPKYENSSEKGLLELARISKPLIEAKLDFAGRLAIKQLEQKKNNSDKATLSEVTNPSDLTSQCKA